VNQSGSSLSSLVIRRGKQTLKVKAALIFNQKQ
jgi:hypothetical protein